MRLYAASFIFGHVGAVGLISKHHLEVEIPFFFYMFDTHPLEGNWRPKPNPPNPPVSDDSVLASLTHERK